MRKYYIIIILITCNVSIWAQTTNSQTPHPWENIIGNMMDDNDEEAMEWEDMYDALHELENNPVDINSATKEDLERIPFLSDSEIADILEYI